MSNKKFKAFSLIEIIVSLAIFSVIITVVIGISVKMIDAQNKLQAKVFLVQTAQITLELMSGQMRFGYNYTGTEPTKTNANGTIYLSSNKIEGKNCWDDKGTSDPVDDTYQDPNASGVCSFGVLITKTIYSQNLSDIANSPIIVFESHEGNPNDLSDQKVFCAYNNKLYYLKKFLPDTSTPGAFTSRCDEGQSILPDEVKLEYISFDVYGDSSTNPKNPMVRIKFKLSNGDGATMELQTTITQRLVSYF